MNYDYDHLKVLVEKSEGYQPDQDQIQQYAEYIGLLLPDDNQLLYLARQALMTQIPQGWEACESPDKQIVYRNKSTKHIQFEHPVDEIYKWKVKQIKKMKQISQQLQSEELDRIDEETLINESSQYMKNSSLEEKKSQEKKRDEKAALEMQMPDITEESQSQNFIPYHSESSSYLGDMPEVKNKHQDKIKYMQQQIKSYQPQMTRMIGEIFKNPYLKSNLSNKQTFNLEQLRTLAKKNQKKKEQLEKLRQQKLAKQQILKELIKLANYKKNIY